MNSDHHKDRLLERITINSRVMAGKPVINGTRLTVQFILGLLAEGETIEKILEEYPGLTQADIEACYVFAIHSIDTSTFLPLTA